MNIHSQMHCLSSYPEELESSFGGEFDPDRAFIILKAKLDAISARLEFQLPVITPCRCGSRLGGPKKPLQRLHAIVAVDINVTGLQAFKLVMEALREGISGIGVRQYGPLEQRCIHLDLRKKKKIWSY